MRERCRCPECKSLYVKPTSKGWRCLTCDHDFKVPYQTPPKAAKSTGSGQIAGPMEYPQYRYGSTRLG
jgi:ribosomal protein L37AE/L43A